MNAGGQTDRNPIFYLIFVLFNRTIRKETLWNRYPTTRSLPVFCARAIRPGCRKGVKRMAWIELHQTLPSNKKTIRLKTALRIPTPHAVGLMCMLWLWAVDNAQDGDISSLTPKELAEVCVWSSRRADELQEALVQTGFVDRNGERLTIHDWEEYSGRLLDIRRKNRERKQRSRLKAASQTRHAPVTGLPDQTEPNQTQPYPTKPSLSRDGGDGARADASTGFLESRGLLTESYLGVDEQLLGQLDALAAELIPRFWHRQPGELDRAKLFLNLCTPGQEPMEIDPDRKDLLLYALEQSVLTGHEGNWPYVEGVLRRLHQRGLKDLRQAEFYDLDRDERRG